MKIFILCFCLILVSGCANISNAYKNTYNRYSYGYNYYSYEVHITSDPSGAKIEWDNNYIGQTPLTYTISGSNGFLQSSIIKAYPISTGQYVQTKRIDGFSPVPKNIYFDMSLVPDQQTVNVNINQ